MLELSKTARHQHLQLRGISATHAMEAPAAIAEDLRVNWVLQQSNRSRRQGQPTAIAEVESTFVNICGVIAGLQVEVSDLGRRELQTCRHGSPKASPHLKPYKEHPRPLYAQTFTQPHSSQESASASRPPSLTFAVGKLRCGCQDSCGYFEQLAFGF